MDVRYDPFLGPKAENFELLKELILQVLFWQARWRRSHFPADPSLYPQRGVDEAAVAHLRCALREFLARMERNIPFSHPRYVAQMLKDPGIPAIVAYFATMLINPNNHAYEGGPVTTEMELEVVDDLKRMLGFDRGWGHLTSGGTLANMEAMWAVRDTLREGTVVFSAGSHYSWKRICSVLRIRSWREIPVDRNYRLDLDALESVLRARRVVMVVANLGTTGTGSVDPLPEILRLRDRYGFHLHVDAAYGGYARSILLEADGRLKPLGQIEWLSREVYESLQVLPEADSVTIDPHKHGLVMYGAGGLIFRDERFQRTLLNTAPYTYHVRQKPNLGMLTLEGSRPGAAAAATWFTHRLFPLHAEGLGAILAETLKAAREFAARLPRETDWEPLVWPNLDIVCFHPKRGNRTFEELNGLASALYQEMSVEAESPEFVFSKFVVEPSTARRFLGLRRKPEQGWITLRAVLMKHWLSLPPKPTYIDRMIEVLRRKPGPG
ncbi:MAG: aminotransferase class I/II-fold pyridoxal phosphate-dependent enzyme [candidate division KSB1 bacterium]|nr:aminotransferase class I/II-fold pyridoxal phosphate-dependent enzyme [candidate division KSB1 bacterium]